MDGRPHAQRTRQPPLASTSIILWCRSRPGCQTDHLSTRARLTSRVRSNRLDCSPARQPIPRYRRYQRSIGVQVRARKDCPRRPSSWAGASACPAERRVPHHGLFFDDAVSNEAPIELRNLIVGFNRARAAGHATGLAMGAPQRAVNVRRGPSLTATRLDTIVQSHGPFESRISMRER